MRPIFRGHRQTVAFTLANFQAAIQRSVLITGIQLLFASVLLSPETWSFHY